ncbi:MAG: hypothetical protein QF704_11760, partial [Anaerolineales bacterium]|nr:hypothetical protein [Anaerolineales bacterium]
MSPTKRVIFDQGDSHTYLLESSNDNLRAVVGGVSILDITTTKISGSSTSTGSFGSVHTAGRVGIGTTAPSQKLHVVGDAFIDGALTARDFYTDIVSSSISYTSGSNKFGDTQDDTHQFTGSVSISGSSPGLSIDGAILSPARINFNHTGSNLWSLTSRAQSDAVSYGSNANNRLAFYEGSNSTPVLQMKDGNVGINTARNVAISAPLYVTGNVSVKNGSVLLSYGSTRGVFEGSYGNWGYRPCDGTYNSVLIVGSTSGASSVKRTALTLAHTTAHATFGGNIGVGATPPSLSSTFPSGSLYAVGNISGSNTSTGSFGRLIVTGPMKARVGIGTTDIEAKVMHIKEGDSGANVSGNATLYVEDSNSCTIAI